MIEGEIVVRVIQSRLSEILEEREMSWAKLSEISGVTDRMIGQMITEIEFRQLGTLSKIANALNLSVKDLFDEVEMEVAPLPKRIRGKRGPAPIADFKPRKKRGPKSKGQSKEECRAPE